MKKLFWFFLGLSIIIAAAFTTSCFIEDEVEEDTISAPIVEALDAKIIVTPSVSKKTQYINIFRSSEKGGKTVTHNICQIMPFESEEVGKLNFIDENVDSGTVYSYYVRYFNGKNYKISKTSAEVKIDDEFSPKGELNLASTEATFVYDEALQTLALTLDDTELKPVFVVINNGTISKPFPIYPGLPYDLSAIDEDFKDVNLTLLCIVIMDYTEKSGLSYSYWSNPLEIKSIADLEDAPVKQIKLPPSESVKNPYDY